MGWVTGWLMLANKIIQFKIKVVKCAQLARWEHGSKSKLKPPKPQVCPVQCCNKAVSGQCCLLKPPKHPSHKHVPYSAVTEQSVDNPMFCLPVPLRIQNVLLRASWCLSTSSSHGGLDSVSFFPLTPNELANNWTTLDSVIDSCPRPGHCLLTFRGQLGVLQTGAETCCMTCMWSWPASWVKWLSSWIVKKHGGACQARWWCLFKYQWN